MLMDDLMKGWRTSPSSQWMSFSDNTAWLGKLLCRHGNQSGTSPTGSKGQRVEDKLGEQLRVWPSSGEEVGQESEVHLGDRSWKQAEEFKHLEAVSPQQWNHWWKCHQQNKDRPSKEGSWVSGYLMTSRCYSGSQKMFYRAVVVRPTLLYGSVVGQSRERNKGCRLQKRVSPGFVSKVLIKGSKHKTGACMLIGIYI